MTDQQRPTVEERLGTTLRGFRQAYGMSQQTLADVMVGLGFSWRQTTVAKTEAAERPVPVGELVALTHVFNTTLQSLLPPHDEHPEVTRALHATTRARGQLAGCERRLADAERERDEAAARVAEADEHYRGLHAAAYGQEGGDDGKH